MFKFTSRAIVHGLLVCVGMSVLALAVLHKAAKAATLSPIHIVSTPNPSVLPLLLAMARDPSLPVQLIPVGNGSEIRDAFDSGRGDGLLSMTWVAASEVINDFVPDLKLVSVDFWRGFFELTPDSLRVTRLADLSGKNLLISGPAGGGRDGGPDLLFQAVMKKEGYDPWSYSESTVSLTVGGSKLSVVRRVYSKGDFKVYYLPAKEAMEVLVSRAPLDDGSGNSANSQPASGAFMVDPAATGIVMEGMMKGASITKSIDAQTEFKGYSAWPVNELPLGGLSMRSSVLADPGRAEEIKRVVTAYERAASDLMGARGHPLQMMAMALEISHGVMKYYRKYGLDLPAMVIAAAVRNADFVYRTDQSVKEMTPDLKGFIAEILGTSPPDSFYE